MKLKKWKFVGTWPSSYEKRIYQAAVSQRLRNAGLRRTSTAARLLRLWVRISAGGMDTWVMCVLSGSGFYVWMITSFEKSCQVWCV